MLALFELVDLKANVGVILHYITNYNVILIQQIIQVFLFFAFYNFFILFFIFVSSPKDVINFSRNHCICRDYIEYLYFYMSIGNIEVELYLFGFNQDVIAIESIVRGIKSSDIRVVRPQWHIRNVNKLHGKTILFVTKKRFYTIN